MKIVCTVTNDLSHDQRMSRICSSLQMAGHEVTLVGRTLPGSPELLPRPYRQHRLDCRYRSGKAFYVEFNFRLWQTIRHWDFDVVCAVDLDTLTAGYALTRGSRKKLVYDAHEWFSETPEVRFRPLIRWVWRTVGRQIVPRTDARYTVAPVLAGKLEEDYGSAFGTVRNLPSRGELSFSENTEGVILYQGMLNPGRGLEVAIEALAYLPDIRLWIVGSGPESEALKALAEKWGVADRTWFTGFRDPVELPAITAQAWLGLNLLESSSASYYYSLANKSLDYIQAGLPSVQMDFPEYRAINESYGCFALLSELTGQALAEEIAALSRDPARYANLLRGCRLAAEELVWENEEPRLLAIYAALAER